MLERHMDGLSLNEYAPNQKSLNLDLNKQVNQISKVTDQKKMRKNYGKVIEIHITTKDRMKQQVKADKKKIQGSIRKKIETEVTDFMTFADRFTPRRAKSLGDEAGFAEFRVRK